MGEFCLAAVVVLSAVLTFGLRREFARLDEMRRQGALRRFLATNPLMLRLRVDTEALPPHHPPTPTERTADG